MCRATSAWRSSPRRRCCAYPADSKASYRCRGYRSCSRERYGCCAADNFTGVHTERLHAFLEGVVVGVDIDPDTLLPPSSVHVPIGELFVVVEIGRGRRVIGIESSGHSVSASDVPVRVQGDPEGFAFDHPVTRTAPVVVRALQDVSVRFGRAYVVIGPGDIADSGQCGQTEQRHACQNKSPGGATGAASKRTGKASPARTAVPVHGVTASDTGAQGTAAASPLMVDGGRLATPRWRRAAARICRKGVRTAPLRAPKEGS